MKKKIVLIVAAVLAVLLVVLAIFFLLRRQPSDTPTETSLTPPPNFAAPQQWDDLFIAANTLEWLENEMRDERGAYNQYFNCEPNGETWICDNDQPSNRTGMAVMWANYQFWKNTNDPAALQRLKNALAVYNNQELVQLIQTNNLSCYYMLPIATDTSPQLSDLDRQNAMNICDRTGDESGIITAFVKIPKTLNEYQNIINNYSDLLTSEQLSAADSIPPFTVLDSDPKTGLDYEFGISTDWGNYATDTLARQQILPDTDSLLLAHLYFAGVLDHYLRQPELLNNINASCLLLLASQTFCTDSKLSCNLATWLTNRIVAMDTYAQKLNPESIAKCALAAPSQKSHFMEILRNEYYGTNNDLSQISEPWLFNSAGSTKDVVANALFIGLIAQEQAH